MYRVRLQHFEGPLDLLLFFIRRDELDIHDIPIARIADEFLETVRMLERIDLDGVGDFLYMAAMLISIKARLLLPTQEVDDDGEPIDPRTELVERLVEYIRFKEASDALAIRHESRLERYTRGAASGVSADTVPADEQLLEATVFDLIGALRRVLSRAPSEPVHAIAQETWTVEQQQEFLMRHLVPGRRRSFVELVGGRSRAFIITTFLAVLEAARTRLLDIFVERSADDFYLQPVTGSPTEERGTDDGRSSRPE